MANTTQAQNTEDKEDNIILDIKNRKKFEENHSDRTYGGISGRLWS